MVSCCSNWACRSFGVAADAFEAKIRADIDSGNRSGVQGTPAFFINGEAYAPRGFDDLLNPIRALLGK